MLELAHVCQYPVSWCLGVCHHHAVYPDGKVCLSILDDDDEMGGQWAANIGLRQVGRVLAPTLVRRVNQTVACKGG